MTRYSYEFAMDDAAAPLTLQPAGNGGWVVTVPAEGGQRVIGDFSTGAEMVAALTAAVLPDRGASVPADPLTLSAGDPDPVRTFTLPTAVPVPDQMVEYAFSTKEVKAEAAPPPEAAPRGPVKTGPWTGAEEAEARRLDGLGKSPGEIGRALNRRGTGVSAKLRAMRKATAARAAGEKKAAPKAQDRAAPARAVAGGRGPGGFVPDAETRRRRVIERRLDALPQDERFTPEVDLAIVERLGKGNLAKAVANHLSLERKALVARYAALLPEVTPLEQADLLAVLRARAAMAAVEGEAVSP